MISMGSNIKISDVKLGSTPITNTYENPQMSSNTTPNGYTVSCSSVGQGAAYHALIYTDYSNNSKWASSYGSLGWLQMKFSKKFKVTSFDFCNPSDGSYSTTSAFNLQGSNDGSSFTTIQSYSITESGKVINCIVNSPSFYQYYRINFTAFNNTYSSKSCRISYLKFYYEEIVNYKQMASILYGNKVIWENWQTVTTSIALGSTSTNKSLCGGAWTAVEISFGKEIRNPKGTVYGAKSGPDSGQWTGAIVAYLEVYCPDTNSWDTLASVESGSRNSYKSATSQLTNNKIYTKGRVTTSGFSSNYCPNVKAYGRIDSYQQKGS